MMPANCQRCGEYDLQHQCKVCGKGLCRECHPFPEEACTECYLAENYKEENPDEHT